MQHILWLTIVIQESLALLWLGNPVGPGSQSCGGEHDSEEVDLANLTGPVNSAILTLNTFGVQGVPLTYTLFDTNATLAELDADRGENNAGGIALFQDLGSGTSYGSRLYTSADVNTLRSITLNSDGRSAIAAAAGRQFALGGAVSTPPPAIPEPATWAMMLVGFGAMGVALRRRQKVAVRFA